MKKILYVGLDVHKESIYVCALAGSSDEPIAQFEMPFNIPRLFKKLKKWSEDYEIRSCYEAGCFGYSIFRLLQEAGMQCLIAAPSLIPSTSNPRIKTDRHDALNLAKMLRAELLTPIHIPTAGEEALRDLLRARQDLQKERTRIRLRLLSFLLRHNLCYPGAYNFTGEFYKWITQLNMQQVHLDATLALYTANAITLDEQMRSVDQQIDGIAAQPPFRDNVAKLMAFKGIGALTALSLICEVGDFKRYATAPSFMSSLGLVPTIHQSGNTARRGSITKIGNSHLRKLLIEGCWSYRFFSKANSTLAKKRQALNPIERAYVIKATKHLETKWHHLVFHNKKSTNVATTAIARELAGFLWGMMSGKVA